MFRLGPKYIPVPAPLSSPSWLQCGGYHGDTKGPLLIGCHNEVRVTRKVETRRCWGSYFFLLFLLSPLSLLSFSVPPCHGSFPLHSDFCYSINSQKMLKCFKNQDKTVSYLHQAMAAILTSHDAKFAAYSLTLTW